MGVYDGKIKNSGTQVVKAPYGSSGGKDGTNKITGNDLRDGGGKSGK